MAGVRLAHALSMLGYCSRREGERLIAQRRVTVNGRVVEVPATLLDPATDRISVDGKEVGQLPPAPTYLAVHKPRGVVSTVRDPHAQRTVVQLVASQERLYPVGRLDKDSEGLIILTNDGSFANRVAHPRYATEREYLALLGERPSGAAIETLRRGLILDGRGAVPVRVDVPGSGFRVQSSELGPRPRARNLQSPTRNSAPRPGGVWLRIVLREGRNREVRRMLLAVGYPVQRLVRTRIGPVRLGNLRPGAYRELTDVEIRGLLGVGPSSPNPQSPSHITDPQAPDSRPLRSPKVIVAIDGPSGVGKTTVGKRVAERLGADFLDTGVLYRALTLQALEGGVSPSDEAGLAELARELKVEVREGPSGEDMVLFDGRDATEAIRSPTVDAFVSEVASHRAVRDALIPAQRRVADAGRAVVAGRDIGTVIFPDAQVKIFLEAAAAERARRRADQSGDRAAEAAVQHDMEQRDAHDRGRSIAPLEPAADAVLIETDDVSIDEVVDRICSLVPVGLLTGRG